MSEWTADIDSDGLWYVAGMIGTRQWTMSPGGVISRGDARDITTLSSAAPDLLKAARLALAVAEDWIHDQLDGTIELDGALAELEPVRAAIAKAEGRQP